MAAIHRSSILFPSRWSHFQSDLEDPILVPSRRHSCALFDSLPPSAARSRRRDSLMASLRSKISATRVPTSPPKRPSRLSKRSPSRPLPETEEGEETPRVSDAPGWLDKPMAARQATTGSIFRRAVRRRKASPVRPSSLDSSISDDPSHTASTSTAFFKHSSHSSLSSFVPASDVDFEAEDAKAFGHERDYFVQMNGEKFHPYKLEEAPYMQAYTHMSFDNDRKAYSLLRQLMPRGPSFHDFGNKHPIRVLDLGCGEGHWVVDAASEWRGARVTGLDLVDVCSREWDELEKSVADRISWVRHNFVQHPLPFESATFNFVRLANATLSIPLARWPFVMTEISRVLAPDGTLEVIDDQLYFPFIQPSSPSTSTFPTNTAPEPMFDLDVDDSEPEPDLESDFDDLFAPRRPVRRKSRKGSHADDELSPYDAWAKEMQNCRGVENIFSRMLTEKYGIHPRPSEFLPTLLSSVFGKPHVTKVPPLHLCLPSREFMARDSSSPGRKRADSDGRNAWHITIEWDKKDKGKEKDSSPKRKGQADHSSDSSFRTTELPPSLSKKAAARLGMMHLSPSGATYQPPGIVVFPSTFIPMDPAEIEMHTCRHMHTLMSCHVAIEQFVSEVLDDDGKPLVDPRDMQDALWDYAIFRRRRFNWPSEIPDLRFQVDEHPHPDATAVEILSHKNLWRTQKHERVTSISSTHSRPAEVNPSGDTDGLTFVRSIRIFDATKSPAFF